VIVKFVQTELPGVLIVEPDVFRDARGFFLETFHARKYREGGIAFDFVQDNHSRSTRGTLRGLHAQRARPQGKLVRAVRGEIFDVAVDIRPGSATFGKWVGVALSEENFRQIWVPPGFAHGFCVTTEIAEVEYKCTDFYDRADEIGLRWDSVGIAWPIAQPLLSAKDAALPTLDQLRRELAGR
jgi:dTDP-4-dehydrorhamnose 3,5-epimerase